MDPAAPLHRVSAPPPRRGSRRRWFLRITVALLLAAMGTGWWATRPARLRGFLIAAIRGATHAEVTLEEARLTWTEGLHLKGLRIAVAGQEHGELFTADEAWIDPSVLSLLTGSPGADAVVLERPTAYLTEDLDRGVYLFQLLPMEAGGSSPARIPNVTVREGRVVFREIESGALRRLDELELEGRITAASGDGEPCRFDLHEKRSGSGEDPSVRGRFDPQELSFSATLDGFRFEQPQRYFLRHELRTWWDRLDPRGAFDTLTLAYTPTKVPTPEVSSTEVSATEVRIPDVSAIESAKPQAYPEDSGKTSGGGASGDGTSGGGGGWSAKLGLADASLNVPLGEYVPRMTGVKGRLRVEGHGLVLEELEGDIEGLRYRVTGRVEDVRQRDAARFDVQAKTDWFEVTPDPAVVEGLPRVMRKYYDRFQPQGRFQLEIGAARNETGGPIRFDGLLRLAGVSGRYHKFPYPARETEGRIRFTNDQIVIEELRGRGPGDMRFAFESGRISPPGDGASVQVVVGLDQIPVDGVLREAMEIDHRRVLDLFLQEEVRAARAASGLLDETWALGGVIPRARVTIHRPAGEQVAVDVTSELRLDGTRMIYRHWPYPMQVESGSLTIGRRRVDVDVRLSGPTGATGRLVGSLERAGDEDLKPDLRIEDAAIPVDGLLIAALPQPQDQWVRDLHASGMLRGGGRIHQPPGESTTFQLHASLTDGQAAPHDGSMQVRPLAGDLLIERGRLTIHQLHGTIGEESSVRLSGAIDWTAQPLTLQLAFSGTKLPITAGLLDLLPPDHAQRAALREMFDRYQPSGLTDLNVEYRRDGSDAYRVEIAPSGVGLRLDGGGALFTDMTGRAVIDRDRLQLQALSARFDDTSRLSVEGVIYRADPTAYHLAMDGRFESVGPTLRAMLPGAVRDTIESLQLDGRITLTEASLVRDAEATSFQGELELEDARLSPGLEVTRLSGRAAVHSVQRLDEARPRLELHLDANQLLAADRLIRRVNVRLASEADGSRLRIGEFLGSIYGGELVGHGVIDLSDRPRYAFDLALSDVALGPFLHPPPLQEQPTASATARRVIPQRQTEGGLFSAGLTIEASVGDTSSRSGRGAVEIRGAALYNQPLPLAVLQTLNLTLPTDRSFDGASARYLIAGDTVLLDTLRFEAPSLAVSGSGTIDWPSGQLDLEMVTRNPSMPDLGPVGEVLNKVKDELVAIRITGTLTDPRGRAESLTGLRRSWDQLFSAKAAHPPRAAPASGAAPGKVSAKTSEQIPDSDGEQEATP